MRRYPVRFLFSQLSAVAGTASRAATRTARLIHRSPHFRIFLDQPAAFRTVRVADFGGGIEWENGLDYGADTLKMMADEQRPMRGADLVKFEAALGLGTAETAALLGLAACHGGVGDEKMICLPSSTAS